MKNSVLKDIFNGVKGNRGVIAENRTNKESLNKVLEYYERLKKRFDDKQIKLIEKFLYVYEANVHKEAEFYFSEGFKLGLQIGVECFRDRDNS